MLSVGHCLGDECPEVAGVVLVREVDEFVDDDVFDEGGREHHGPPVEAKGAVGGAASPALTLVADEDAG